MERREPTARFTISFRYRFAARQSSTGLMIIFCRSLARRLCKTVMPFWRRAITEGDRLPMNPWLWGQSACAANSPGSALSCSRDRRQRRAITPLVTTK